MRFHSRREKLLWAAAGLYLAAIYSTLYSARFATDLLRRRGLLRPTIYGLFALAAVLVVVWVVRQRPGWRELALLAALALLYPVAFHFTQAPEEELHLLEYGIVGGLFYQALLERRRARPAAAGPLPWPLRLPAPTALLLTVAAGWLDEGIQGLLPNRYYDLRDVGFNAAAGALAIAAFAGRELARRRDRRAREA